LQGKVIWFNDTKGYGFIECEDGKDVFVHYTGIIGLGYRTLEQGEVVTFTIIAGPKGPQADKVVKMNCKEGHQPI
jgi:CspA family cold shock protein